MNAIPPILSLIRGVLTRKEASDIISPMKELHGFALNIPIEKTVHADGTVTTTEMSIATSEEAHNKCMEIREKMGSKLERSERIDMKKGIEIFNGTSKSFGFSNWNCGWNPKGPKPNWIAPEDPSKN
jgi:hypothetical protein